MLLENRLADWDAAEVRRALEGLPVADGYRLLVKPLRYRTRPSLKALCDFEDRRITVQVPDPFEAFTERVPFRARRVRGKGFRFQWEVAMVPFRTRREVVRFLYLHEYYHWYLREILGRKSGAETACDRYALHGFRRRRPVDPPPGAPERWLA
ncbi:MAG: hypothetical protein WD770_05110 [Actinomycetota bacterium]